MALKCCKECGSEISSSAKSCPKCGKKQKNIWKTVIIVLAIFFVIGAVASSEDTEVNSNELKEAVEQFSLVSDEMTTDSIGSCYIQGTIQNNTNKSYSYVQVTFNLYDANGNQLGTAMDNINNLEPNATWKYKAIGLTTEKVHSYKFVEITGW